MCCFSYFIIDNSLFINSILWPDLYFLIPILHTVLCKRILKTALSKVFKKYSQRPFDCIFMCNYLEITFLRGKIRCQNYKQFSYFLLTISLLSCLVKYCAYICLGCLPAKDQGFLKDQDHLFSKPFITKKSFFND